MYLHFWSHAVSLRMLKLQLKSVTSLVIGALSVEVHLDTNMVISLCMSAQILLLYFSASDCKKQYFTWFTLQQSIISFTFCHLLPYEITFSVLFSLLSVLDFNCAFSRLQKICFNYLNALLYPLPTNSGSSNVANVNWSKKRDLNSQLFS